jgi:hypothetical protein
VSNSSACEADLLPDGGVTRLDDLPVAELCATPNGLGSLWRWDSPCAGSIVVSEGIGADCDSYWLFDVTTKLLQATAYGCVSGPRCTGGVPGFSFPIRCFDGSFATMLTRLCTANLTDGAVDGSDSGSAATDESTE